MHGGPLPKAYVFETGSNVWKAYDAWPPKTATVKTLYFHAGGRLSFDAPGEKTGVDEYVSDPAHPVPFVAYVTDTVPQRYMADDQRFAAMAQFLVNRVVGHIASGSHFRPGARN